MSSVLFGRECRANYKIWLIFAAVLTMYSAVIVSMFDPKLGESLNLMAQSMPELFAAFGMASPGVTMLDFLVNYLYGFLYLVFPLVLVLLLVNRLLARYLERGAMAWLLAAPHPRRRIAATQGAVLALALASLVAYVTGLCMALSAAMFPGELDMAAFLRVNAGLLGMLLLFGGICFAGACVWGGGKGALAAGGGVSIAFWLLQMLASVGEKFGFLKYLTPLTLFDPHALAAGGADAWWPVLALYLAAAALFGAGVAMFSRRDLCL